MPSMFATFLAATSIMAIAQALLFISSSSDANATREVRPTKRRAPTAAS
jgi:hypothetical protein